MSITRNTRRTIRHGQVDAKPAPRTAPPNATPPTTAPYRSSLLWRAFEALASVVDRRIGWDRLPVPAGLLTLLGLRTTLRKQNLYDTSHLPATDLPPLPAPTVNHLVERTADGSYNDLAEPRMGMAGSRFGRNIPLDAITPATPSDVLTPNPREISRRLLTRTELIPASAVNSLVAAWIQFMIRDWFSHGTKPDQEPWEVPLRADDPWPERPMRILRTPLDPTRPPGADLPQTRINVNSHWWDASQIYGTSAEEQALVRSHTGGKLAVLADGRLPIPDGMNPATVPGFWIGLEMMRTLFTLEHNAICDRLLADFPDWTDQELFSRARLVNAALIAKIHTVEWTPAIISHPTTKLALRANWFGVAGERVHRLFGRISNSEVLSGIPGGPTDQYGVPYALTEEFVAVYRMHPLIRDDWQLRAAADDALLRDCTFRELAGPDALVLADKISMADLFYSFGTLPPGLVTLHNFPKFLQEYLRPDGHLQDLAATDILRTRELGVPRYNEFRRLLHLAPARDFTELTDNAEWATEIESLYGGDIEQVDLEVGMFAERRPQGFAFSDTAFRIFILMASRRLNSDRFFTEYYTPAVYTQAGLDWVQDNSMASVLLRHYPALRPAMAATVNAFEPWRRTGQ
jgi:hypothetical protein